MKKKIIGMSVTIAFLAMLCVHSVAAQAILIHAWTDKPQYDPGEKGTLKISVLNELDEPVEIYNITIEYPWFRYDAKKDEWVGNETIEGDTRILATMTSKGGDYYKEVEFSIPSDGRAVISGPIYIDIETSNGTKSGYASLSVAAPSWPILLVDMDMWMTSLTVVVVICTIILAIVVFLSTRRTRHPRVAAPPPPPQPKAKTA